MMSVIYPNLKFSFETISDAGKEWESWLILGSHKVDDQVFLTFCLLVDNHIPSKCEGLNLLLFY